MNCPKCNSSEIDAGGFCLVCGLRAYVPEESSQGESAARVQPFLMEAEAPAGQAELPEWRLELSRRLQEIKLKREGGEAPPGTIDAPPASEAAAPPQPSAAIPEPEPRRPFVVRKPRRTPGMIDRDLSPSMPPAPEPGLPSPPPDHAVADRQTSRERPPVMPAADMVILPAASQAALAGRQDTQELIDKVFAQRAVPEQISAAAPPREPSTDTAPVSRLRSATPRAAASASETRITAGPSPVSPPAPKAEAQPGPSPTFLAESGPERKAARKTGSNLLPRTAVNAEETPIVEPAPVGRAAADSKPDPEPVSEPHDVKLILLSRTLAGLVDLIIVILCAGFMILAVDILEGIEVFDAVSKVYYGLLFLVMYFVYSVFFLGTAGQTIGMMLTDLRLTDTAPGRPAIKQILVRCCAYLASLAFAGLGLVWGIFDHEARCLHDIVSQTRVVKTLPD